MGDYNDSFSCFECHGYDGDHSTDCSYYGGRRSSGSGGLSELVFCFFVVIGILLMLIFPPLGAGLIWLGAYLTGQ